MTAFDAASALGCRPGARRTGKEVAAFGGALSRCAKVYERTREPAVRSLVFIWSGS